MIAHIERCDTWAEVQYWREYAEELATQFLLLIEFEGVWYRLLSGLIRLATFLELSTAGLVP